VTHFIEVSIQLAHDYGLGVNHLNVSFALVHEAFFFELRKSTRQHLDARSLGSEWQANNHETMSHHNHFVELDDLHEHVGVVLQIHFVTDILHAPDHVLVVWLGEHSAWEQVTSDVLKERQIM
jgi:post-segregation antitoxin (ccd killing protein)